MGYSDCDTEDNRSPAEKVGTPLCICCTKHLSLDFFLMRPIHANTFVYAQFVSNNDMIKTVRIQDSDLVQNEMFC